MWTSEGAGIAKDGVALTATTPEHPSLGLVACCPSLGKVSSIFLYSASIHCSFSTCTQRGPWLPLSTWMGQSLSPQSSSQSTCLRVSMATIHPLQEVSAGTPWFCIPSPPSSSTEQVHAGCSRDKHRRKETPLWSTEPG